VALRWTIRDASACVAGEHALREARDHLETLLRERTSELAGLNAALESERAERRCVEKSLREGRQLLQAVEDAALGMVYARDLRQQGPIHANTRVLERLGYPSDAARLPAPDQATDLVHPEDGAAAKDHRERLCHAADGEVVETTVRLRHSDGSWRWVRFREVVSGRDAAGEPLRGTGTAEDVTEQRAAQTALADAQRLIDAGRLAASFAHEINNPLQGALGCLSLLEEALSEGGEPGRYLEMAQDQTRRAVRVVGQLRDLSRLVPAHAERVATDLRTSLSRVAVVVEKRCSDQRVELIWDPPDAVPDVLADPDAIEEVFLNLTLNALDAMPDGGTLRLAIESTAAPPGVRVTCADSGPGIDTELLPRLFDSFVTNKTEGMGLGLYVSRDIVEQHGGRIEVETQAGRGTTFFVWLALHATPSASPLDRPSPPL